MEESMADKFAKFVIMPTFIIILLYFIFLISYPNRADAVCIKVEFELNDTIPKSEIKIMEEIILTFDDKGSIFKYTIPNKKFLSSRNFERYGVYLDNSKDYPLIAADKEDEVLKDIIKLFEGNSKLNRRVYESKICKRT